MVWILLEPREVGFVYRELYGSFKGVWGDIWQV